MLWVRSASLMRTTRMSLAMAMIILRKFSACFSSRLVKLTRLNLVTPSTRTAISSPKADSISGRVARVSSTVSWSSPQMMLGRSSFRSANRPATATGWVR